MNIFNYKKWGLYLVIQDIINYRDWIRTINKEKNNKNSKYNKLNLNHNWSYCLYVPISLDDADKDLHEDIKKVRIIEISTPINRYLDEDLMFAEYIVPEFFQFMNDDETPTLTYGIIYRFAFNKLSINWIVKWGIISSILTWIYIHFNLSTYLVQLIDLIKSFI
jgi:hypothetical protein